MTWVAATLFLWALFIPSECSAWEAKVIKVTDGDTITVLSNQHDQIKIRIYGIDAPEKGQPWGKRAKQALSSILFERNVEIEELGKDRYGRTVAKVKVDGQDVGSELVLRGLAWVFPRYCKLSICEQMQIDQESARKSNLGLWVDHIPIPPWKWRGKGD